MNSVSAWPGATRLVCSVAVLLSLGLTLSAAGAERLAWQGHETRVMFVAFSPDGKRLVSGSYDSSIKVWDAGTGKELATLQEKGGYFLLESMAISSVGQVIASGKSTGGFVTLWDLNTYKLLHQLPGHKRGCTALSFAPDGKVMISASQEDPCRFWDVKTGKEIGSLKGKIDLPSHLCYSPDGKTLAIASSTHKILTLWDVGEGKVRTSLEGNLKWFGCLTFSPDGKLLASAQERNVILWDVATGKPHATLDVSQEIFKATSLAFSPDGKLLSIMGRHWMATHIVDLKEEREIAAFPAPKQDGGVVAFSPDGKLLVTGSGTGKIAIWEVPEKK